MGLAVAVGLSVYYVAEMTWHREQFGWDLEPGFIFIFVVVGVVVGPVVGLAGGLGAVLLLRLRAAFYPPALMHYLWTAGLGAGAVATLGAVVVLNAFFIDPTTAMMVVVGLSLGVVSGIIAALQTQRVLTRD
ncbi:hypothetical protein AC792_01065 [Arthrobacter sp. RIT-PI-e]|nr:hypothetical protein AC792_01065 [Arthrobacter sp. RIT-PI-e]